MAATRKSLSADLHEWVGAFLATRLQPDERLCVGLSGGCDSVVLLNILSSLGLGNLSAIHVHHGLSPNADDWAAFCAGYCERLGVPLTVRHVAVDRSSGLGLEAAARAARYGAFAECTGDCLLLAQHRGDQAETVLFNLLRGTGVTGAAGMPVERRFGALRLLRPLLDVSRADIESYAAAEGLAWIDDESNADTSLTRNFLRHEMLTVISQRFPSAEASLAQAAGHFAEATGLLDELAAHDWQLVGEQGVARMTALRPLSLPRLKNLLRYRLRCLGWQVPVASRLDEFARQLQTAALDRHPELVLPDGKMRVAGGRLHWLPEK
jgi:tRNA(Ile)-lysidine synthase